MDFSIHMFSDSMPTLSSVLKIWKLRLSWCGYNNLGGLLSPSIDPCMPGWIWTGVGAAVAALLTLAKQRLPGWPLHPIGFLAGGTWILGRVWFSIFVAWLVKASVLKYNRPRGYRITRWFFLGLILGQVVAGGFWMVVDGFTGMHGSRSIWIY